MTTDADAPIQIEWRGRYLEARRQGRWEYLGRVGDMHAAVIVAIDDGHVILVDQYRVPLGRRSLELPAGLVGDEKSDESLLDAAARELEEETGYRAGRMEALGEFASTPGMASETFTLVRAHDLTRVGEGGGVDGEAITVHRVALADLGSYVAAWRAEGCAVDVRLLAVLGPALLGL